MNTIEGVGNRNDGSQVNEKLLREVEVAFVELRKNALHVLNTKLEETRQKSILDAKEGKSVEDIKQGMVESLEKLKLIG